MHVLLTNDDGIEAEGLQYLADALRCNQSVKRLFIVAPIDGRSCCGHTVNTATPIAVNRLKEDEYSIDAWPADCVRVATRYLGIQPNWVISGINHGGNLGLDILMSGTCSGAREAAWNKIPSIAVSQYRKGGIALDWTASARRAVELIEMIWKREQPSGYFWNVNVPALDPGDPLPAAVDCFVDSSPYELEFERMDSLQETILYRSAYQERPRVADSDIDFCFRGFPTVSLVSSTIENRRESATS